MIVWDTGPLYAVLDSDDAAHAECATLWTRTTDRDRVVPAPVFHEACQLVQRWLGADNEASLIEAAVDGELLLVDLSIDELRRCSTILRQYTSFDLGLADASVVAVAERLGCQDLATLDQRHFRAIEPQHCDWFRLLPHDR